MEERHIRAGRSPSGPDERVVVFLLGHAQFSEYAVGVYCKQPSTDYRFGSIGRGQRPENLLQLDDVLNVVWHATPEKIRRAVPGSLQEPARHMRSVRHLCAAPGVAREAFKPCSTARSSTW
jgi:hypothetical protein